MDLSFGTSDEADRPLPVAALKGTPEEIERQWYEQAIAVAATAWRN